MLPNPIVYFRAVERSARAYLIVPVRSAERCARAYLIVAARSAERSALHIARPRQSHSFYHNILCETSPQPTSQERYDRRSDRRRWGVRRPCRLIYLVCLSLLSLFALGCSRQTSNRAQPPSQKQITSEPPVAKPQLQTDRPETSVEELEAKLEAIRTKATAELRLKKRAPSDLHSYLAELDGKLFDLLLDGGIDESALMELKDLPSLFHLRVRETALGDETLGSIVKNHPDLQVLNLPRAAFTQAGIQPLNQLPKLKQLRIGGNWIDDEIVAEIAKLPKLHHLHLIQPKISAAALESLADSPKLTSLYIDDCELPDSAWKKLFNAKPNLHVHIDQHHHDRDPGADGH